MEDNGSVVIARIGVVPSEAGRAAIGDKVRMIKRFFIALLLLGVVVGGIVGFNLFRSNLIAGIFAGMQPPPVTVSVIAAETSTWRPGIDAIGTASAARGVDLAVEAGGVVEAILFSANDRVEAGELLMQIRDEVERADLAAANASLELSQTELARALELQERGVSAANTVETAEAGATNARSQVVRLTAILDQKALEAPFAGVVGIPQVEVGQYVVPGTVFATLQDLDTMRVDFSIPEQQARVVEIGMQVIVSSELDGAELTGTITGIEPKIDPNSRLLSIRATVDNTDGALNPGQFLRVRIVLPEETGVIALPQTVLSSNLYGDSVFALRRAEGSAETDPYLVEQVFVTVGRRSSGLVEIVKGVVPGDLIVTAGQNRLAGGARAVIDNSVTLGATASSE